LRPPTFDTRTYPTALPFRLVLTLVASSGILPPKTAGTTERAGFEGPGSCLPKPHSSIDESWQALRFVYRLEDR
jgi:hypothetical protein